MRNMNNALGGSNGVMPRHGRDWDPHDGFGPFSYDDVRKLWSRVIDRSEPIVIPGEAELDERYRMLVAD